MKRGSWFGAVAIVVAMIFGGFGIASADCDVEAGKQVYGKNCAACHGKDGKGMMPKMPDFSKGDRMDKADNDLVASIGGGVKGTIMPAWKGKLSDVEMANALCYIKSLGPKKAAIVEPAKKDDAKKTEASKSDPCGDKAVKKSSKKKASK